MSTLSKPLISLAVIVLAVALAVLVIPAGAQAVPAEEFVGPFPSWRQVQCTGVDDTAMLQAELTGLNPSADRAVLFIKPGTCRITSTLSLTNRLYVTILGADPATTKILWAGPAGGRMFQTDGVSYSRFGRLTWDGGGTAHVAYELTYATQFSTGNRHEDEVFVNLQRSGIAIRGGVGGIGDAETEFVRCHFIGPFAVGILLKNYNTLDYWVWDSEFRNLDVGVGNVSPAESGAGGFSVNRSLFVGNATNMLIANTNFFSSRWNVSRGSGNHIVGQPIGKSPAPWTSQGETIIDPSSLQTQINMGNVGAFGILDAVVREPGYVKGRNWFATVVEGYQSQSLAQGDLWSFHNTFSTTADPMAYRYGTGGAGRNHGGLDDVLGQTIADPVMTLPGTPPASSRPVIEVQGGNIAAALATVGSQSVIVHIPAGTYSVPATLEVGPNVILTGDGHVATRLNSTGADPILHLAGPSHAVLRDFSFYGWNGGRRAATGIAIDNADQPGGLVHVEDWHNQRSQVGVDVVNLSQTMVDMLDSQEGQDQARDQAGTYPMVNYRVTNGTLHIFNGAGALSDQMYELHDGELVSQTMYYENNAPTTFIAPNSSGSLTLDVGKIHARPGTFNTSTFSGQLTLINMATADRTTVTLGPNTLVLGFDFGWGATDTARPGLTAPYIFWLGRHIDGSGGSDLTNASDAVVGVVDQAQFLRDHLAPLRGAVPRSLSARPANVTDVRMYRVGGELMTTGLRVSGSGTPPVSTSTPVPTDTPIPTSTPTPTSVPATATPTSTPTIPAAPIYRVRWDSHGPLTTMAANSLTTVPVSLTNTSNFTWLAAHPKNPVHVSYHWVTPAGANVVWDGRRTYLPSDVPPGGSLSNLGLSVQAPVTPGDYVLRIDVVREAITWFSTAGSTMLNLPVRVT